MDESFGSRLKALRIHFGLSQKMIAKKLNISKHAYLNYENDKVLPQINLLVKLKEIFGVNTNWLVDGSGSMLNGVYLEKSIQEDPKFQELFYWLNKYPAIQFAVLSAFENIKFQNPEKFKRGEQ